MIYIVIILNIVIRFFQKYAAKKTIESLHSLLLPTGTISRGRQTFSVLLSKIIPGNIIKLRIGDTILADI